MFAWLKRWRRGKAPAEPSQDDTIARWAARQLAPWLTSGLDGGAMDAQVNAWNTAHRDIYVFDFAAGRVRLREKPATTDPYNRAEYARRASVYHDFFQTVLDRAGLRLDGAMAMTLEDYRLGPMPAPLGAFQRRIGDPYLLFPDIDTLSKDFYEREPADPHDLPPNAIRQFSLDRPRVASIPRSPWRNCGRNGLPRVCSFVSRGRFISGCRPSCSVPTPPGKRSAPLALATDV